MDADDYLAIMRAGDAQHQRDGGRLAALTDPEAAAEGRELADRLDRVAAEAADPDLAELATGQAAQLRRSADALDGRLN